MIRLFLRLIGIKDFEVCQSCETLKRQLEISNLERRELTETLLRLVKPEVIHQSPPVLITPSVAGATFAQRRKALENMHKQTERVKQTSPFIAKADSSSIASKIDTSKMAGMQSVSEIEASLGIEEVSNG